MYSGASCHVKWLDENSNGGILDIMDSELFIRSYYGAHDFDSMSSGVYGRTVKNINEEYESTEENTEWTADTFNDRTSEYSPFE